MAEEREEEVTYVLLDFQGKDVSRFLKQSNIHFRMFNLNEAKPTIEIEEDIYEGVYEDTVGTNLFFEEVENPPKQTNIFEGTSPITLKFLLQQSKILKLKKIGIKSKPIIENKPTESVNLTITDDYRVLLDKYENGTLSIDDYIVTEPEEIVAEVEEESDEDEEEAPAPKEYKWEMVRLPPRQDLMPEWYITADTQKNSTYSKYAKLQKLSEKPAHHNTEQELIQNPMAETSNSVNQFIKWKNMMMRIVEQQPINLDVNKDKIEDFVDIQRSVEMGIIAPSNKMPRFYTHAEKESLLSFQNFINLSPLMKLIMLHDFIGLDKAEIEEMTPEELEEKGDDGCTPVERLKLLKEFWTELKGHIVLRLQDAQSNDEGLWSLDEINLDLSDLDDFSETEFDFSSDECDAD